MNAATNQPSILTLRLGQSDQAGHNRIKQQAHSDALTACGNRYAFAETMARLERDAKGGKVIAVLVIDLDRFKQINDTFGHEAGDTVLTVFADRLRFLAQAGCSVFRMGGDEFALVVEDVVTKDQIKTLCEQVVDAARTPISSPEGSLEFGASVGVAISDGSKEKVASLYKQADTAAFAAKLQPGSNFIVFNSTLDGAVTRKFEVEQCLKSAIQKRSINIAVQPQVDLRNGAILGYEALARWSDPLLGKVCPSEFIPIAEQSRLIEVLDRQVIVRALRGASVWLPRHQHISINASARSLNSNEFADFVINQVRRTRLKPEQVELEITETALIENWTTSKKTIEKLRANKIRIALDDFGVGYSSLSYLIEFPIQKIKFDRSFIQRNIDGSASLVLQSMIDLSKKMNLELVVEGIETKEQLRMLRKIGCFSGQGFLLGRPTLREDILDNLTRSQQRSSSARPAS